MVVTGVLGFATCTLPRVRVQVAALATVISGGTRQCRQPAGRLIVLRTLDPRRKSPATTRPQPLQCELYSHCRQGTTRRLSGPSCQSPFARLARAPLCLSRSGLTLREAAARPALQLTEHDLLRREGSLLGCRLLRVHCPVLRLGPQMLGSSCAPVSLRKLLFCRPQCLPRLADAMWRRHTARTFARLAYARRQRGAGQMRRGSSSRSSCRSGAGLAACRGRRA